jgi:serine/threonine protein kinase
VSEDLFSAEIRDRYEFIEKLDAGSMGVIYRARDKILEREIAIKAIRTGKQVDPEIRERFYREARACARLRHPSIVTVYDLGEAGNVAFIAMELLSGLDFRKLIERRVEIALATKLKAMVEICEGLAHAHRHSIVHRDIKPSNLFLTDENRAKILDFGIARLPSSTLTVVGHILGTPNYMAPEQILAKHPDFRSDLFSAGVVFFELLVFHHPFFAHAIPERIVEGEPDSLFDHDTNLPPALGRIFLRAMAKDPNARYKSGDEFASDLKAVLEQLPADMSQGADARSPAENNPRDAPLYDIQESRSAARRAAVSRATSPLRQDPPSTPKLCPYCGASNRSAALYCIQCGASVDDASLQS